MQVLIGTLKKCILLLIVNKNGSNLKKLFFKYLNKICFAYLLN
jgi:hypothetical protein